jgi:hypothetical protein
MFPIVAVTTLKKKLELGGSIILNMEIPMPQIWLTYDELATLMGCETAEARSAAAAVHLDRRRSRDGQTRAKLSPSLTEAFLNSLLQRRIDLEIAAGADNLRAIRAQMAISTNANPRYRAATR